MRSSEEPLARPLLIRFLQTQWKLLIFRDSPIASTDRGSFLALAMGVTWLAGCGRYWDHRNANWWQYAGLGSVAYVVLLAGLLWMVGTPLRLRGWSYPTLLLFVCMTSPPALLYAIPVERFLSLPLAQNFNLGFLVVVAAWRVALLVRFLAVPFKLGLSALAVGFLPLCSILVTLTAFNMEHATFEIMGSGSVQETPHDGAYLSVVAITGFALVALLPMIFAYLVIVYEHRKKPEAELSKNQGTRP